MNKNYLKTVFSALLMLLVLNACSPGDSQDKGDKAGPVFILADFSSAVNSGVVSGSITINWITQDDNPAKIQIALVNKSNNNYEQILDNLDTSSNKGSYVWNSTLYPDGSGYKLRLRATDVPSNRTDIFSPEFTIKNTGSGANTLNFEPTISGMTRSTGSFFVNGMTTLSWNGNKLIGASFLIELSANGGNSWSNIASFSALSSNSGSIQWDTSALNGTGYTLRFFASNGGEQLSREINNVNIDNQAPSISDGDIAYSANSGTNLTLSWIAASEAFGGNITYSIYHSSANTLATLADLDLLTPVQQLQNQTSFVVNNIASAHTDSWNILVQDENGNKAIYNSSTPNGIKDYTFTSAGYVEFDGSAITSLNSYWSNDLVVDSNARVVTVGSYGNDSGLAIWRYLSNANLDNSFNKNGYQSFLPVGATKAVARAVTVDSNNNVIVCGSFSATNANDQIFVAKFLENGNLSLQHYPLFDGGPDNCNAIALDASGNIYFAGWRYNANISKYDLLLNKLSATGVDDANFNAATAASTSGNTAEKAVFDMTIDGTGNLYLAGYSTKVNDSVKRMAVWKYDSSGSPVSAFGSSGLATTAHSTATGKEEDIALGITLSAGQLYLAGSMKEPSNLTTDPPRKASQVCRFNSTSGAEVTTFGNNGAFIYHFNQNLDDNAVDIISDGQNKLLFSVIEANGVPGGVTNFGYTNHVFRINSDGTIDRSYADNGIFTLSTVISKDYDPFLVPGPHLVKDQNAVYLSGNSGSTTNSIRKMLLLKLH